MSKIAKSSKAALLSTAMLGAIAAVGLAAAAPETKPVAPAEEGSRLCKFDGKVNSIGAVIKDDGHLYRCTLVLEERGVGKAAWVHVEMTTSIVVE